MQDTNNTPLVTTAAAAEQLGISATTFRRWALDADVYAAETKIVQYGQVRLLWDVADIATLVPRAAKKIAGLRARKEAERLGLLARFFGAVADTEQWALSRLGCALAVIGRAGAFAALGQDVAHAVECMHALNRAVKHQYDRTAIYGLKDRLCDALLRAGKAKLYTFEYSSDYGEHECRGCGRHWVGRDFCLYCDEHSDGVRYAERWYVVDVADGAWRFHRPESSLADVHAATAVPCEPHNPTQGRRKVPEVVGSDGTKLTKAAQIAIVEAAIAALEAA